MKNMGIKRIGAARTDILNSPYRLMVAKSKEGLEDEKKDVSGFEMNPVSVVFGLGFMIVMLCGVSILQFNATATKGYELKKLELARLELSRQSSEINLREAEIRSMDRIANSGKVSRMTKVNQKSYVEPGWALAKKN